MLVALSVLRATSVADVLGALSEMGGLGALSGMEELGVLSIGGGVGVLSVTVLFLWYVGQLLAPFLLISQLCKGKKS